MRSIRWSLACLLLFAAAGCSEEDGTPVPDDTRPGPGDHSAELDRVFGRLRASGASLRVQAWLPPVEPGDDAFGQVLARARRDARGLLERVRRLGGDAVEIVLHEEADRRENTVDLAIGDRTRTLHVIADLADVELPAGPGETRPVFHRSLAEPVLARAIALLLEPPELGRLLTAGPIERSHRRVERELSAKGLTLPPGAAETPSPEQCDVLLVLGPQALTAEQAGALRDFIEAGGRMLLTLEHPLPATDVLRAELARLGVELGEQQLFNGVQDPMSGETTYGSENHRIVVLDSGMASDQLVTLPLARNRDAMLEVLDARAVRLRPGASGSILLRTEPFAWEGEVPLIDGKPDPQRLQSHGVGAFVDVGKRGGRLVVIAGDAFSDRATGVGNSNAELLVRLVEWLAYR